MLAKFPKLREEIIAQLIAIRDNAAKDLAAMPARLQGSQWEADRKGYIEFASIKLEKLSAMPAK